MYTEINTKLKIYISNWLLFMFFLVAIMIVVGGLTRLTDSGLSITEWEFFKGFFPPINKTPGLLISKRINKYLNLKFKIIQ